MKATIDSCPLCSEWIRGTEKHFCVEKARVVRTEEVWELIGAASTKLPAPADSQLPPEGPNDRSEQPSTDEQIPRSKGPKTSIVLNCQACGQPWTNLTKGCQNPDCEIGSRKFVDDSPVEGVKPSAESIQVGTARASERRPRYDLLSLQPLLEALAARAELGLKHGRDNWKQGDAEWIIDRTNHGVDHLTNWLEGKDDDDHLAAAAWCLYALLWHRANNRAEFNKARNKVKDND